MIDAEQVLEQQDEEIVFTDEEELESEEEEVQPRRSEREKKQTTQYKPAFTGKHYSHLITQAHDKTEYDIELAKVAALYIDSMNEISLESTELGMSFVETYNLKKGMKKFGERGEKAAYKEMKQLHDRVCFRPINPNTMTPTERRRALESLLFLVEKKSGEVKARTVANGSAQ